MEATQGAGVDFSGLLGSVLHALIEPVTGSPGGYPDSMFLDLSEEDKENNGCNICFLIVKDPRECPNHHIFCASCIFRWSMSGGETNSRCPVCRTAGRYKPHQDLEKKLLKKHVKCPNELCTWAGKLRDYRFHSKSHPENEDHSIGLPEISENSQNRNHDDFPEYSIRSRQRLERLMETFQERLLQRRENIMRHQQEQERQRQESLAEVESLGRRLGDVSSNINHLLTNMHHDSQRYQQYVTEAQSVLPANQAMNDPPPNVEEARVERLLATSTPTQNPFVISELDSRNMGLHNRRTPQHNSHINPYVIPPEFRLPPRGLQISPRPSRVEPNHQRRANDVSTRIRQNLNISRTPRANHHSIQLSRSTIRPNRNRNNENL